MMRGIRLPRRVLNRVSVVTVLGLLAMLLPKEGHVTQVHYEEIELKELVEIANGIVIVEKTEKFQTQKEVPIVPKEKTDIKKYPPFVEMTYHFKVLEVLYSDKTLPDSGILDVSPANQDIEFNVHQMYYVENIGESPIYESYNTPVKFNETDKMILFVNTRDFKKFIFTVEGSYEVLSNREKIEAMIKKINKTPSVPVDVEAIFEEEENK
jgi:hypothetical protein